MGQLHPGNLEINIVGDFDPAEVLPERHISFHTADVLAQLQQPVLHVVICLACSSLHRQVL